MRRQCRFCSGPLYGRSDKLYCSSTCRSGANRVRQRAAKTAPPDRRPTRPQVSPIDEADTRFMLGGVEVGEQIVGDLIRIVDRPLARKLDMALRLRARMVGLSSHERRDVLAGLADAQGDLLSLREVLLTDPNWRRWEPSTED